MDYLIANKKINPKVSEASVLVEIVEPYLTPLVSYLGNVDDDQKQEIRRNYGSGGKAKIWRIFETVINESMPEFLYDGLKEWIRDNTKQFNAESYNLIQDIEYIIKADFQEKLEKKYGDKWLTRGIPPKVYKQANILMGKQNYENSINEINKIITIWDCVTTADCRDIATFGSNWTDLFEADYTRPEENKINGGKVAKTEWIAKFSTIARNTSASHSFSEEEYLFLKDLHQWLINR